MCELAGRDRLEVLVEGTMYISLSSMRAGVSLAEMIGGGPLTQVCYDRNLPGTPL